MTCPENWTRFLCNIVWKPRGKIYFGIWVEKGFNWMGQHCKMYWIIQVIRQLFELNSFVWKLCERCTGPNWLDLVYHRLVKVLKTQARQFNFKLLQLYKIFQQTIPGLFQKTWGSKKKKERKSHLFIILLINAIITKTHSEGFHGFCIIVNRNVISVKEISAGLFQV